MEWRQLSLKKRPGARRSWRQGKQQVGGKTRRDARMTKRDFAQSSRNKGKNTTKKGGNGERKEEGNNCQKVRRRGPR